MQINIFLIDTCFNYTKSNKVHDIFISNDIAMLDNNS
jgi:hypothetical protein